jgi:GTP-binding protein
MHTVSVEFLISAFSPAQFPRGDRPEVAFVGRSNVGKSSLINSLLGKKEVAKVSATPGRTRAVNFFDVTAHWRFVDLPGYGYAEVPEAMRKSWKELIEVYLVGREALQGVVLIVDIRRDPKDADLQILNFLADQGRPVLVVATKVDKLSKKQTDDQLTAIAQGLGITKESIVPYSSLKGTGRQAVWEELRALLDEGGARMKEARREEELERAKSGKAPLASPLDSDPILADESGRLPEKAPQKRAPRSTDLRRDLS